MEKWNQSCSQSKSQGLMLMRISSSFIVYLCGLHLAKDKTCKTRTKGVIFSFLHYVTATTLGKHHFLEQPPTLVSFRQKSSVPLLLIAALRSSGLISVDSFSSFSVFSQHTAFCVFLLLLMPLQCNPVSQSALRSLRAKWPNSYSARDVVWVSNSLTWFL